MSATLWPATCGQCKQKFKSPKILERVCPDCQKRKALADQAIGKKLLDNPALGLVSLIGLAVNPKATERIFGVFSKAEEKRLREEDLAKQKQLEEQEEHRRQQEEAEKKRLKEEAKSKFTERMRAGKEKKKRDKEAKAAHQKQAKPAPPRRVSVLPPDVLQAMRGLGLEEGTLDIDQVKDMHRQLALKHHPDRNPTDVTRANSKMALINKDRDTLLTFLAKK